MTGWRLGWVVAPQAYVRQIEKLAQHFFISPSTPAQHAALAAFTPATLEISRNAATPSPPSQHAAPGAA
jgi:aspartate/methionine/tyrosine aminotransferase